MRWTLLSGVFAVAVLSSVAAAEEKDKLIPPVVQNLGPVVPTPAPSPENANRIRMITSFTVQNKPDGDSIISFEATDFAKSDKKNVRILANEMYSLVQPKPELRELRERIMTKLRDLEGDLLQYVEKAGPPREREPVTSQGTSQRPYR